MTPQVAVKDEAPIKQRSSHIAWSCRWYRVRKDEIELPNGELGEYNIVDLPPCIFIVPVAPDGRIALIHIYRYTLDRWVWEIPAGSVESEQTPLEAAIAELHEEVGGFSSHIDYLGEYYTATGVTNEIAHFYVAWDCEWGDNALESAEVLTVHLTPLDEVLAMIARNELRDVPSALAIMLAAPAIRDHIGVTLLQ